MAWLGINKMKRKSKLHKNCLILDEGDRIAE